MTGDFHDFQGMSNKESQTKMTAYIVKTVVKILPKCDIVDQIFTLSIWIT